MICLSTLIEMKKRSQLVYFFLAATEHFITSCPGNRTFIQKQLRVKPLEITAKVKVENIPPRFSSEHLSLHYDKYEVVEDVVMTEEDQSAIITFQDPKGKLLVYSMPWKNAYFKMMY